MRSRASSTLPDFYLLTPPSSDIVFWLIRLIAGTRQSAKATPSEQRQSAEADQQHQPRWNFRDRCLLLRPATIPEQVACGRIRSWVIRAYKVGRQSRSANHRRDSVAGAAGAARRKSPLDRVQLPGHVLGNDHLEELLEAQRTRARGRARAGRIRTLLPRLVGALLPCP